MSRTLAQLRTLWPFLGAFFLLLLALWLLVFPQFPLTRLRLERLHQENVALAQEINETAAHNKLMFRELAGFRAIRAGAMQLPEQTAMVSFRERIESAAMAAGLRGRTIGNIRCVVVENDVLLFDVAFSAEGTLAEVTAFLQSLENDSPRLYWRNVAILPDRETLLSLSGTLSALSFPAERGKAEAAR